MYKYKPDADIVFWSYNWGNCDNQARMDLINNIPEDITLMATYEINRGDSPRLHLLPAAEGRHGELPPSLSRSEES